MDVDSIIQDGVVDQDELDAIRKECLGDDGKIDRNEADQLFAINDGVSDNDNCPGWEPWMVYAITSHLTEDEESPGEVDEAEATWLIEKVGADGKVDGVEKAIIDNLCSDYKVPQSLTDLQEKGL